MVSGIKGNLDIVSTVGIYGWVWAGVEPGRLARVTCTDRGGRSVTFVATEDRPDVGAIVAAVGKLGFAVPLELFDGLDRHVTFTDESGTVLVHGDDVVLPAPLSRSRSPDDPLPVLLHIPKTGGTSLRRAMEPYLSKAATTYIYAGQDSLSFEELDQMPPHQRSCSRLVMGHILFGTGAYFGRAAEYAAFLRQPVPRIRSNFAHLLAEAGLDEDKIERLVTTVNEGSTHDFDNVMTRMIAGIAADPIPFGHLDRDVVDLALHNIRTSFFFVGLNESFREHSAMLGRALLGRDIPMRFDNVSPGRPHEGYERIDWDGLHHRNRFDQMLYDAVVEQRLAGVDLRRR